MTSWESWLIAISIAVVATMFIILVVFLVMTLMALRRTIKTLDTQIHSFDPLCHVVSGVGEVIEKKTKNVGRLSEEIDRAVSQEKKSRAESNLNTALEVAEWSLIGLTLWQKIKNRR